MKKNAYEIIESINTYVNSAEFKENNKVNQKAFSRTRKLSFHITFSHIAHLLKISIQVSIYHSSGILSNISSTKQAFCVARKKISPTAFKDVNKKLCFEFYKNGYVKLFFGFILLAIDGTTYQLPDSKEIKKKYGVATNQKGNSQISLARGSFAYDVLNGISTDAIIDKTDIGERALAIRHAQNNHELLKNKQVLYLYDRGYPSYTIMFHHNFNNENFVIRSTLSFFPRDIQQRIKKEKDFIIELNVKKIKGKEKKEEFFKLMPNTSKNEKIKVRIVVLTLSTEEKEILITSLLDSELSLKWFKELYHLRWGAEENYKFNKNSIEIENFSGKSDLVVHQDFYATVLAANINSLIGGEAQKELEEEKDWSKNKYEYKINKNVSMGVLKNNLINLLFGPKDKIILYCNFLKQLMKGNTVPIRNNRRFPRERKCPGRKYNMNTRRCC